MKKDLFDELIEKAKEANPDFDENNSRDLDIAIKSYILSRDDEKLKESYLNEVVAKITTIKIQDAIKQRGQETVSYQLKILDLEKAILEKKIEITKKFLN